MTTLIPKYDLKNGGATPAGAINRPIYDKLNEWISVKDFGAVGDNATNDYAAIQAAFDFGAANNRTVYFPDGNYRIHTGLVIQNTCGIQCSQRATITANDQNMTTLTLGSGNWAAGLQFIPQIAFGKIGLLLNGANLANIFISNITGCDDGLVFQLDNTTLTCADNVVTFTAISNTIKAGIRFNYLATTTSGTLMQGNQIKGNFIINCLYGVHFYDINNGTLSNLPWDDTEINVYAIDLVNRSGSIGIWGQPSLPPGRYIHRSEGYFDSMDFYIVGAGNGGLYKLAFVVAPVYGKNLLTGISNKIINASDPGGGMISLANAAALTTAVNTRASFNGGNPVNGNRFFASITIPAGGLAAGSSLEFYFYHPLMTQYNPKITTEPFWGVNLAVLYAIATNTPGVPNPNSIAAYDYQGTISVIAHDATVAAGTYYLFITVSDTNN
jgi:hypothetical protein